ncbi:MAG: MaoC family dehydratase N-terminal domain-containing protein [Alphaproteobacteria bacterium]
MTDPDIDIDIEALRGWIGRSIVASDTIDPWHAAAMHAALDRDGPAPAPGRPLPAGWHWLFFREAAPARSLDRDGHAARGDFLPPVPLPRRMWAGGRIAWHAPLPVGAAATRRTAIQDVALKRGTSGPLVFVTVAHEIAVDGAPVLREEHDIVYRGRGEAPPAAPAPAAPAAPWQRTLAPDPVLLFRYSALTFNGHRIHYDIDYCRDVEGYPGLVVHGPLTATLLMAIAADNAGGRPLAAFAFRARAPLFCGETLALSGGLDDDRAGAFRVAAHGPAGRLVMTAEGRLAEQ